MNNTAPRLIQSQQYWYYQIIGFTGITLCGVAIRLLEGQTPWMDALLTLGLVNVLLFIMTHLSRLLLKKLRKGGVSRWFLIGLVPLMIGCSALAVTFILFTVVRLTNPQGIEAENRTFLFAAVAIQIAITMGIWFICYGTILILRNWFAEQFRAIEAERVSQRAELSLLRQQIHPHFFFNCMNSIASLIDVDSQKANDCILRLSSLMRSRLNSRDSLLIPFQDEWKRVEDYLYLEKIRFDGKLELEVSIDESLSGFPFPGFVMETLVENAIKHGIAKAEGAGFLRISVAESNDGQLDLNIVNSGTFTQPIDFSSGGFGLENCRSILEQLYHGTAKLEMRRVDERTVSCHLNIPRHESPDY